MKTHLPRILVCGLSADIHLTEFAFIRASSPDDVVGVLAAANVIELGDTSPGHALPTEFVWMPAGTHEITAFAADGSPWTGTVVCDEAGFRLVQAAFHKIRAAGHRVPLDKDHEDKEATAWVQAFRWDPARGIIVQVEWTSLGEQLLRGKVYHSFSPAFLINKKTSRVTTIPTGGRAVGGLVNAPAFGTAMPSLLAAKMAGASIQKPASGGNPDKPAMKELLIKILAALAVTHAADATEEQLVALATKHIDRLPEAGEEGEALKAQLAELQKLSAKDAGELIALRAKDKARRTADAKAAVEKAVARGAIPAKDEAIQAKWRGMIEANPDHAELLAALPDNPALSRVTQPGAGAVVIGSDNLLPVLQQLNAKKPAEVDLRASIYARDIAPLFAKKPDAFGRDLLSLLAANSLGTLSGELITQRSLTLLKRSYPELFAISTDFSDTAAAFNQVVKARLRTIPTVTDYNATTGYATSDASAVDVPVTINGHKAVQIAYNANELGSTTRDLFGEQVEGCHAAIGADLVDTLLAVITAGNFANATTQALATFARAHVTAMAKALTTRNAPRQGRFLMLNLDYYEKLGQDTSIVSLATMQQADIITENRLPRVGGMQPYEVQNFPTTGNLTGFGGTADSLALSTRVPNDYTAAMPDVPSTGSVQVVKNLDTGISCALARFVDHKLGAALWRLAYMRGAAVGQAASGQRLISA